MDGRRILEAHLKDDYTEPIRDPLWRNIYVSSGLLKIIDCPCFQKLKKVRQLGPTFHVYPGATHSRFLHSLGVFHTAKNMLLKLLRYMRNVPSLEEVQSFLAACLLHDIGHFPYAHSLKGLGLARHETLTAGLILDKELRTLLREYAGADPQFTADIVDGRGEAGLARGMLNLFRNMLSGVLDPDKLDYLCRDAYFCGVPYGVQDIEYIFDRLTLAEDGKPAIFQSGMTAVEHLLFSKYLMYKTVYWHKTVRIATAMVKKVVFEGLNAGVILPDDLYMKDDEEFMHILKTKKCPGAGIIEDLEKRLYYKLVFETPFNADNPIHKDLEDPAKRGEFERRLASGIFSGGREFPVIVDVPEPVTFEADIALVGETGTRSFTDGGSVFSKDFAGTLSGSLRIIRVLAHPETAGVLSKEKMEPFFRK